MKCLLLLASFIVLTNASGETCQTPSGQNGECIPLAECQPLLFSFSNSKQRMYTYLEKFECVNNYDNGIFICCPAATDVLVFEDEVDDWDPNSIYDIKLNNLNNCGIQSSDMQNNQVMHLKDFPWLVKLVVVDPKVDRKQIYQKVACTGVLITLRYILYSAQCYSSIKSNFFVRIDTYTGVGGNCNASSSSYTAGCSNYETYEVEDHIMHRFYDPVTKINNIGLLRLSRRIQVSEFVRPICLPLVDYTFNDSVMHTAGWNTTVFKTDVTVKTSNLSTSITNSVCKHLITNGDVLTNFDMCTVNGTSTDDIAAGYPLMSQYKNKWYIVGFTSRGKEPKIHTRVQNYLQWIQDAMGGERCPTPSNEIGECIQLTECPRLMAAFANVDLKDFFYLLGFVYGYPGANYEEGQETLRVCCSDMANFTISTTSDNERSFYNISDNRFCGFQHRDDYILLDEKLSVDEFPWLAAVVNGTLPTEHVAICGGALITDRYVLTSAQCLLMFSLDDVILVRLGHYNLKSAVDCVPVPGLDDIECNDVQEYKVEESIPHPFYNKFQYINDICLLRLEKIVIFTDYVRPICLPTSEDDVTKFGKTFYMTGFGNSEENIAGPKIKKKIFTTLISLEVCSERGKSHNYANPAGEYQICTELFANSTDVACIGDEGGPVMFKKKNQWYIEGISSSYGCRDREPLTHLRVFKYLKWIKINIED